ncbi:MAG: flagellin [Vampirovibrionales bacterium]
MLGPRSAAAGNTVDLANALQNADTDLTGGGLGIIDSSGSLTFTNLNSIYNAGTDTTGLTTNALFRSFLGDIDGAIQRVSDRRGSLGAMENRLQGVSANLNVYEEAISSSHSVIRDVDIARATSDMAQAQVKQQAAQSVLAQINQFNSSVIDQLLNR